MHALLKIALEASLLAGEGIMKNYREKDIQVELKEDYSPLTMADRISHEIIQRVLSKTDIPIISEESELLDHKIREQWEECWIVDPLDGTKEFISRNGEFTVNIALVNKGSPVFGVIFAPALNILYFGDTRERKAFKVTIDGEETSTDKIFAEAKEIKPGAKKECITVVGSRSHMNEDTLRFIEGLRNGLRKKVQVISRGSSLKFCLVAEGKAQYYPRYAPTMEWDTAAGQAICQAVGLHCRSRITGETIIYNRKNLLNDHFLVSHEG